MSLASKASLWQSTHYACTLQTCYQLYATFLTCFYSEKKSYEAIRLICNFLQRSCESLTNSYKRYFTILINCRDNRTLLHIQLCMLFPTLCPLEIKHAQPGLSCPQVLVAFFRTWKIGRGDLYHAAAHACTLRDTRLPRDSEVDSYYA